MLMLFLHELLLRQILSPCGFILVWFKLRTAVNNFIPITIQFHVGGCWLPVQPVEKCLHIYSVTPRITISSQAWFIRRFDKCAPSLWVNNIPPKRKGERQNTVISLDASSQVDPHPLVENLQLWLFHQLQIHLRQLLSSLYFSTWWVRRNGTFYYMPSWSSYNISISFLLL